jgi:hypothetical protein
MGNNGRTINKEMRIYQLTVSVALGLNVYIIYMSKL